MEKFNPKRPGDWITALQKLLKTYRLEYVKDEDIPEKVSARGINQKMRDSLDTALSVTAEKSLTAGA